MGKLFCSACEVMITKPSDEVLMPVEGMYACSLECEDIVTFELW